MRKLYLNRRGLLGCLAASAAVRPVVALDRVDDEIIAAGERFAKLLHRYQALWFEWARLAREAQAATEAKFGSDLTTPAWREPSSGESVATLHHAEVLNLNGAVRHDEAMSVIWDQMEPLAELIQDAGVATVAGLRSKALVAIWDSMPGCAIYKSMTLDACNALSLLRGVVGVVGLSDLFASYVDRVKAGASLE